MSFSNLPANSWYLLIVYCLVIRFALFTPTIFYWVYATDHYELVSGNVELHNGTYDTTILTGEKLADKWSMILFIWNLCIWLPSMVFIPPLNLPITIVDTVLTVFLSMASSYQFGYTPYNLDACRDPAGLESQRPPGTNESFFAAAARLNETGGSPTKMCLDFVKEKQYGVALS
jgi:hypothetical protein